MMEQSHLNHQNFILLQEYGRSKSAALSWDLADTQLKLLLGGFYACYGRKYKTLDP